MLRVIKSVDSVPPMSCVPIIYINFHQLSAACIRQHPSSKMTSSPTDSKIATIISMVGTIVTTSMVVRSIAQDYVPPEIKDYFYQTLRKSFKYFSNQMTIVINEHDGLEINEIYDAGVVYLGSKVSPNTSRIKVFKPEKENSMSIAIERKEEVVDVFNGVQFKWTWECRKVQQPDRYYNYHDMRSSSTEVRYFELSFHKKHKELALNSYLPFVLKEAKDKKQEIKTLKIFTLHSNDSFPSPNTWDSISLVHPATFETLAMDVELKKAVMQDLERFVKRRDKYRKVGKAWKRGYLLYGPPGTGKSSLIAAMANYLKFDIYDLELQDIRRNSDLRKMLLATANRSILVVEDIDCNIEFEERVAAARTVLHPADQRFHYNEANKVTLSGFLNFIDGLWSSCGDERIIIFTTNHKEKLDPALLRPGRMDMHIHMSYCTPCGFKLLAKNYLEVKDHKLFGEIEKLIRTSEVTPADVAEQLLKSDEPDVSLASLITFLHSKGKKTTKELNEPVSETKEDGQKVHENQGNEKIQKSNV